METRLLAAGWWWRWALRWNEHTEVDEPCTGVELRVDGLDLPRAVVGGLHDDVAGDDLRALGGLPADGNGVAVVPDVELLEWATSSLVHKFDVDTTQMTYIGG